jgi:hypothetical protein
MYVSLRPVSTSFHWRQMQRFRSSAGMDSIRTASEFTSAVRSIVLQHRQCCDESADLDFCSRIRGMDEQRKYVTALLMNLIFTNPSAVLVRLFQNLALIRCP